MERNGEPSMVFKVPLSASSTGSLEPLCLWAWQEENFGPAFIGGNLAYHPFAI